jgi:TonB family protein
MFETSISIPRKKRQAASMASVLLHLALAIILFTITVPEAIERRFRATPIYLPPSAPTVERIKSTQPVKRIIVAKPAPKLNAALLWSRPVKTELALPAAPVIPVAPASPVALSLPPISAVPPPPIAARKPEIRTGGFESGTAPASRASDVGVRLQASGFDSAAAPPARSVHPGVAAGGAFGDGAETVVARAQRAAIVSTQFDAVAAKPSPRAAAQNASSGLRSPIEITSKPRPLYTEEARRLRIEGEVVLQVMFRASSEVCVLHVLRGLGHGLDENAISAASAIRFRPATDGGRPIDDVATVRITFQLAD